MLAHRGLVPEGSTDLVENSFAAVAAAHAAGATYVESDCHVTLDGEVVLFHDDDLQRIAGDPRAIAAVTLAELSELMAGLGGLLTLDQALESFPTVRFNLDVKAPAAAEAVGRAVAPYADRVLLTSFSDERRRAALAAAADAGAPIRPATSAGTQTITRLLLASGFRVRRAVSRLLSDVDALQVPERRGRVPIVTPRLIENAHRHGVEVHVWTVNDPSDMERLLLAGVDGLVTDRADVALPLAARHAS
ncbi:glycerophosphodiester phosphodiesterase family protein [Microbacterium sp. ET2]|uniref:glycerophosphodiester phosphodiesterase family protein n=1 Tax=Microbacterium albipurpureum TaxID=3050384 RepID=UPI00259C692A|nr:glycerophosphodiester phosphodiesterase family protein [Microbacterium sp. ET2 (Ac-2212)]WJL95509.1 glycerophosphodiester phosphodiesterase family protein [Microbacterium sp. ET2 (Ac-2212)]